MSIGDVSRGYRRALERQGHEISDYRLGSRFEYHRKAIPETVKDQGILARQASETILNEALYCNAELVLIISGLNVHPIALWLLGKAGIRAAVILTESPYDDEAQRQWTDLSHVGSDVNLTVFTNDRISSTKYGWHFLPPSFDPAIHYPVEQEESLACDVLMIGTGWTERQQLLEAVNWEGIDLKLFGIWPNIVPGSALAPFYVPEVVSNAKVPTMYCSAKINLNVHRGSEIAMTPGPRVYELAACCAFQMSDPREDLLALFNGGIPTFTSPRELEEKVRYYLDQPEERRYCAGIALDAVCAEDFDKRASTLMAVVEHNMLVA